MLALMDSHAQVAERQTSNTGSPARLKARVIIPVWGTKYVTRLGSACLPALLAPGNLPHLAKHFDCELVVVTERRLFDEVRALEPIRRAQRWCSLRLVAMDDVLSHPSYYGLTLTHCFYRGFVDLGEAAKETWCLFVHADFILADGSYRSLVECMLRGERLIMSPSYCTIEERVRPVLDARVASGNGVLDLSKREMAGFVLDHRHFTIRAKTINSRMYRIDHVDQFYYLLDNDTLLGRQLPIAIVAFRPERVPKEPIAFWDYGVISEICPTANLCVLGDSDDFLMMELRTHRTMAGWLKLGWMDKDEIAHSLSRWMTTDQRRCGTYPLVVHRRDLPPGYDKAQKDLDEYLEDVMRRVKGRPRDHRDHYIWTGVIAGHQEWIESRETIHSNGDATTATTRRKARYGFGRGIFELLRSASRSVFGAGEGSLYRQVFDVLRAIHLRVFGRVPDIGPLHPHRLDLSPALDRVVELTRGQKRALSIWTVPNAAIAPNLSRWISEVVSSTPDELLNDTAFAQLAAQAPYDFCFLELTRDELVSFGRMHARLRDMMRPGAGHMLVLCRTRGVEQILERDFALISGAMPERDIAEVRFQGGFLAYLIQRIWEGALTRASSGRSWDLIRLAFLAMVLAPLAFLSNRASLKRNPGRFPGFCTSVVLEIEVV